MPPKAVRGKGRGVAATSSRTKISGSKQAVTKGKGATKTAKSENQPKKKAVQPKWTDEQKKSAVTIQVHYRYYRKRRAAENARIKKQEMEKLMEEAEKEAWLKVVKMEQEKAEKEYQKSMEEERERKQYLKRIKTILESSFDDELHEVTKSVNEAIEAFKKKHGDVHPARMSRLLMELVDCRDANDYTPLSEAAAGGAIEVIRWLCEQGANPNSVGRYGRTPLYRAAFAGHVDAVGVLLESGADPRIKVEDGNTALDVATNKVIRQILDDWDITTTEVLLENLLDEEERRATQHNEYRKMKVDALLDKVNKAEEIFKSDEKQLIKAYQELNRRIFEHDKCVVKGVHVEVTLQTVHDAEDLVVQLKDRVETSRKELQNLRLQLREEQQQNKDPEKSPTGVEIKIKELDDVLIKDVGNKIKTDGRWPFIIDESGQGSIFIRYIDTNYINALNPVSMEANTLRVALLGAIRYGKPLVIDLMGLDMWHIVEERFNSISNGLLDSIIDKSIIKNEAFANLIKKEDGPEYEDVQNFWSRMEDFKLWVLSTADPPPSVADTFYTIKILPSQPKNEFF